MTAVLTHEQSSQAARGLRDLEGKRGEGQLKVDFLKCLLMGATVCWHASSQGSLA